MINFYLNFSVLVSLLKIVLTKRYYRFWPAYNQKKMKYKMNTNIYVIVYSFHKNDTRYLPEYC